MIREWKQHSLGRQQRQDQWCPRQNCFVHPVNHDGAPSLSRPIKSHKLWKLNTMSQATELKSARARQHNLGCLPWRLVSPTVPLLLLATPDSKHISWACHEAETILDTWESSVSKTKIHVNLWDLEAREWPGDQINNFVLSSCLRGRDRRTALF